MDALYPYLPFWLAVTALALWTLVFGGVADHWRTGRTVPSGVVAAFMLVVAASVIGRLLISPYYFDRTWTVILWAHVERALQVTTGAYALVVLIRSRLRWRADGTRSRR